jgi:hypothetical protein
MSVFAVEGTASVRVELQIGSLQVLAGAREDVAVDVKPTNPDRPGDRSAAEAVRVDHTGGTIVVKGPHTRRLNPLGPGKDSVDVVVEVPEGSEVAAIVKYGSARLAGRLGEVRADVAYGEFLLDAAERLEFKGGHGNYRVTRVEGDAQLKFKYGAMRIGHIGGRLRLSGAGGPMTVNRVDGSVELESSNGSIELGTASAGANLRAAYGTVRVREAVRGVVNINGSYGNVDVGVKRGTAVWLDASSQHGVVRSDLSADAGPATGDDTLELQIRTGYGAITVHHAQEV